MAVHNKRVRSPHSALRIPSRSQVHDQYSRFEFLLNLDLFEFNVRISFLSQT